MRDFIADILLEEEEREPSPKIKEEDLVAEGPQKHIEGAPPTNPNLQSTAGNTAIMLRAQPLEQEFSNETNFARPTPKPFVETTIGQEGEINPKSDIAPVSTGDKKPMKSGLSPKSDKKTFSERHQKLALGQAVLSLSNFPKEAAIERLFLTHQSATKKQVHRAAKVIESTYLRSPANKRLEIRKLLNMFADQFLDNPLARVLRARLGYIGTTPAPPTPSPPAAGDGE